MTSVFPVVGRRSLKTISLFYVKMENWLCWLTLQLVVKPNAGFLPILYNLICITSLKTAVISLNGLQFIGIMHLILQE